jgi:hypothetical protein
VTNFTPKVRKQLSEAGWRFQRRGKDDHEQWINPKTGAKLTVAANIRSRHTANGILKGPGIGKKF